MTIKGIVWRSKLYFNNLFALIKHPWLLFVKAQGLLRFYEMGFIFEMAKSTQIDTTPILDIGSHLGLSSNILSKLGPVYSFEWFRGLQDVEEIDEFKNDEYVADKEQFLINIRNKPIKLFDGDAVSMIKNLHLTKFSFAYLDLDLYKSTKEIFIILDNIARPGNVLISHDAQSRGISQAIKEFNTSKSYKIEYKWNFVIIKYI